MRHMRSLATLSLVLGLAFAGGGCGDSTTSSNPPAGYGTLQVSLTDGPIDLSEISNLFITFDELYVIPTPDSLPPDSTVLPIHVITSPVTLDLLALGNGLTTVLGTANLPEGNYRAINIVVNEGNSWLIEADGDSFDVKIPSHHLKVITDFSVTEGQVTDIVLDFDAAASLHKEGNGQYILRPVIRQLPDDRIGASISGDVLVDTGSGLVPAGQVMVANPWLNHHGSDQGHGNRPGDKHGKGRGRDLRATVPLTVAWPMIVHAEAVGDTTPDDDSDDDSAAVVVRTNLGLMDNDHEFPPGDPRFHHAFSRGTVVGLDGHYKLWRLRKDGTYDLTLHLHPHSGYEVVSGPGTILLDGNKTGQNFVIRAVPATP